MRVNPVLQNLPPDPISEMRARVQQRRAAGLPVVDFTIGDPLEPTPTFIPSALRASVPEVSQYPLTIGRPELRAAIAEYVERRLGVAIDPDRHVVPTSGSKEAVFSTAQVFVDRDRADRVVFPSPSYPSYERGALFAGAKATPIVCDGDFVLRADAISPDVWQEAAVVWSCSPHNPTGSVTSNGDLADLIAAARRHDTMFFSDECYLDLYEESAYPSGPGSALQVAGDGFANVLVFLSLSKRSGMTGYRSGAIVGDADAIDAVKRFRRNTGTASPDFVQLAGAAAWSDDNHVSERRAIFSAKRAVLRQAFDAVGMLTIESNAGLYMWIAVGDDVEIAARLLEVGVVVTPGRFFGGGGEGYVRLALVPELPGCEKAARQVVECLG